MDKARKSLVGRSCRWGLVSGFLTLLSAAMSGRSEEFRIEHREDRLVITDGPEPVTEFVYKDEKILRPYFANVHVPGGFGVTRPHPPDPATGSADHADMHPGIWMGFGDVSGHDFWFGIDPLSPLSTCSPCLPQAASFGFTSHSTRSGVLTLLPGEIYCG